MQHLTLANINLAKISTDLLAASLTQLLHIDLMSTPLHTEQAIALLSASINSSLLSLNISCVKLDAVPSDLLTESICRLSKANLI